MPVVTCEGHRLDLAEGQTVLDALLSAGLVVPSSCRAGACQACLVQATRGTAPAAAQQGLKEALRLQGYFLACQARPDADIEVSRSGASSLEVTARVMLVERLASDVLLVRLALESAFEFRPGQFVTLVRGDGLARSYSLANTHRTPDRCLDLHVRVLVAGRMSGWLAGPDAVGQSLRVRGPAGDCFYVPGRPEQSLLLIGTGTGLAPLWAVLDDALANEHQGPIELWHGAPVASALYLRRELQALAERYRQLRYRPCVLEGDPSDDVTVGSIDEHAMSSATSLSGRRVYLCGDPALVQRLKRQAFLKGASLREIHADAFLPSA